MTRYENVDTDKVQKVALSIAYGERKKNSDVPVVISPTAWNGEEAVRFRVDRVIEDEVPDEPTNKEENHENQLQDL